MLFTHYLVPLGIHYRELDVKNILGYMNSSNDCLTCNLILVRKIFCLRSHNMRIRNSSFRTLNWNSFFQKKEEPLFY